MEVNWIDADTKPDVGRFGCSKQVVLLLNSGNIVTGYWYKDHWEFDGLVSSKDNVLAWLDGLTHDYIKQS